MKICFLCDEYPPAPQGGIGSFVQDMGRGLVDRGHQVIVLGVYPQANSAQEEVEGVRIVRLAQSFGGGRLGFIADRLRLGRAVRCLWKGASLDLVEAPETGGWGANLPRGLPLVVRLHSSARYGEKMGWRTRRGRLIQITEDIALRRAWRVAAVSRWVAARAPEDYPLAGLTIEQITVIHNGVDTSLFAEAPYGRRVPGRIVFAGTLKPQKGVVQLLKAVKEIFRRVQQAELLVAGKDSMVFEKSYWASAVAEAGLEEGELARVHRLGPVQRGDLPALYDSAAVCVFPSLAESFGLVAAEAMSCARPVVYSRRTVGPELIENGVDGLLVDPERPEEITSAVIDVLTSEGRAEAMGVRAAAKARREFSLDRCVDETVKLYDFVRNSGIKARNIE